MILICRSPPENLYWLIASLATVVVFHAGEDYSTGENNC